MSNRFFMPRASAFDTNGDPISGGKLWFYEAGTSTPRATYSDAGLTVANANPVVANSAGRFGEIFLTPSVGYKVVLTDADNAVIWTADPYDSAGDELPTSLTTLRNRVINGGMQLSRENGENNVDVTENDDDTLDNWLAVLGTAPGGTLRVRQLAQATPGGSNYRMRCSPQVTDSSLDAGNYYVIAQRIEGYEIADAEWGSAFSKQVLVRFGVQTTVPGTYGVSICNDALNRSWVGTFAISASEVNQDVVRTFAIPGTNAGTWLQTTGIGMRLRVCLAAGSTYQGAAGWQTGDFYTTSAQTNFMASSGAWFDLFDVGLYVDTAGIGVLPSYEMPSRIEDLLKTQRYFWATADAGTQRDITVVGSSAAGVWTQRVPLTFPVRMRAAPTISVATTGLTNAATATTEEESATGVTLIVTSSGAGDFAATYTSVVADARL
jgi:hypothetical protein